MTCSKSTKIVVRGVTTTIYIIIVLILVFAPRQSEYQSTDIELTVRFYLII